ncbi:LysM peptidoglycan-binding domain-containing protein [Phytoactinopolyspora endophytica]|uniref:LysM peptidoglycan-binding domain-containing protein n=1 Tax=Phytoactinopolyspora endophytica TaxID=1642495 RepID=UPI00101D5C99|nr:hypothetical protein [Phytoactinopolyspora endophytica]
MAAAADGSAGFDELVAAAAALAAWVLVGWIFLIVLATVLTTVPGRLGTFALRCADRVTPVAAQHLAKAALGLVTVAVPLSTGAAAHAGPGWVATASPHTASSSCDESVGGGGLPEIGRPPVAVPKLREPRALGSDTQDERTADTPPASADPDGAEGGDGTSDHGTGETSGSSDGSSPDPPSSVTVAHGDTLWNIAADHLGPDATPAEVAEEWPRWFQANRDVIGPDPDTIRPGVPLQAPKRS